MKPGMAWPIGITAILATSVIGNLIMMRVANNDPSFAIEDNYYQRAVDFDTTMQQQRRSDALGWTATVAIDGVRGGAGLLRVQLSDSSALPITADSVIAVAFFNARANERARLILTHEPIDSPGAYQHAIAVAHPGQWEVQIGAWRGHEHFVLSTRVEVKGGAIPPSG
ncbi:MAG: FixH family protein, partial [Gemmatimonadaceae bacterium]